MSKILEHQIETAFMRYMWGWRYAYGDVPMFTWIERQVSMPQEGRADIIGIGPRLTYVVELKRGRIKASAAGQLIGYLGQLKGMIEHHAATKYNFPVDGMELLRGVLVGSRISTLGLRAASAMGFECYTYRQVDEGITFKRKRSNWRHNNYDLDGEPVLLGAMLGNAMDAHYELVRDRCKLYGEPPY